MSIETLNGIHNHAAHYFCAECASEYVWYALSQSKHWSQCAQALDGPTYCPCCGMFLTAFHGEYRQGVRYAAPAVCTRPDGTRFEVGGEHEKR